ncbi:MAG: 4-hydroxythreonine-4-phosphate dehydrogenase PdxA [Phycisphaerales bacterium]|nr:4-hydroxythreonine-4-phosphate dehydrogenase PdxA [Planctomycetota bacterium]MBL6997121.1 4-hydroxythreonine-4-phosphate dehydrogenase PdxA [Phycisphaerales bacterium]
MKPTIGITMGDPGGIGPEIIAKSLQNTALFDKARFVIYGANESLTREADTCNLQIRWDRVDANSTRASKRISSSIVVLDDTDDELHTLKNTPSKLGGHLSKSWVESAIKDSLRPQNDPRAIDAVVTAPICKQSWALAGYKWLGHTELFASRMKARRHAMMFVSDKLRVVLATCHIPLMEIRNVLTIGKVHDAIDLAVEGCKQLGIENPRIGVTGLNPHAGEGDILGDEESRLIKPAIQLTQNNGHNVEGPFPADTIFSHPESFDVIVAMYHDQGLLPIKLLSFGDAVNWTLGLPIIRTSPDHGTAFDIANTNSANPNSLLHAIELACSLTTKPLLKSKL